MWKIISPLFICLFLISSHSEGSSSTSVYLWQTDQFVIQGVLPQEWIPLSLEELNVLNSTIPGDITHQSGKIVSSYQFFPEPMKESSSNNPQIVVFLKTDEHVNQEMIQKTYSWLEKNKNLLSGMLSDKVDQASIQNIEYRQKIPAILFQNNLRLADRYFTGLSSIIFLNNSILTIVCLADEKEFIEYSPVYRAFLESVVIPPGLQHDTVISAQSSTLLTEIFALLDRKWQPLLGVFLIAGIYGWVLRMGREKRI